MLQFYNTLTRKKELFKPIKKDCVSIYTCGPTVYNYIHIGNLRTYIVSDLLKRYLGYKKFHIKHVMNITDVDDKTIHNSQKNNQSLKEFTDFYFKAFLKDLKIMNIQLPDIMPRATEHIPEMINLIQKLISKKFAYKSNDGSVYYKIASFKNYGKLACLDRKKLKIGASQKIKSQEYEKQDVADFVLWKAWTEKDGDAHWESPWGQGRPGWHIECSTMAIKHLGKHFDIHCGGVDLIFPHHTNEIAQSEAATGKTFVNYWFHNAHLLINGQKMSKTSDNFYTLKDIIFKGFNPLLLRVILIKTHYRQILNFNFNEFKEAENITNKFINFLINLKFIEKNNNSFVKKEIKEIIQNSEKEFEQALDDDLNISLSFTALYKFINQINKKIHLISADDAISITNFINKIDTVFGFINDCYNEYLLKLEKKIKTFEIQNILFQRIKAKKEKNYNKADVLRKKILSFGLVIEDLINNKYILKIKK